MKKVLPWVLWLVTALIMGYYLMQSLTGEDKTLFLPGQTSAGHYQIELQCEQCHGDSFSDKDSMQKKCLSCHAEELKAVKDSHPKSKFTDPRNVDRIKVLDARYCVTCHVEHKPEITRVMGVTKPEGFCIKCHEDVAEDRPSHADMGFATCASAGCHNFHDNRALYEDFLVKHAHEPPIKQPALMPEIEVHDLYYRRHKDIAPLTLADKDATGMLAADSQVNHDWAGSSHAAAGINCSGCHLDKKLGWLEKPDFRQCQTCHQTEVNGFLAGKHGMRLQAGLSPMRPGWSRLSLNPMRYDHELGCHSCHSDHEFDTAKAAVDACLGCHADEHSKNYRKSAHFRLWSASLQGKLDKREGVSCATCHMPAVEQKAGFIAVIATQHNQNMNLRPNEKMIRSVCLNCHGLPFSIDALADENLIKQNFHGRPAVQIDSVRMATVRVK